MIKNPQLPHVNSSRGAPMGRNHYCDDFLNPGKCRVFRLRMRDGGYDEGGAYWGTPANVYCCCSHGEDIVQLFTRASNRKEAKQKFLKNYPNLKFIN